MKHHRLLGLAALAVVVGLAGGPSSDLAASLSGVPRDNCVSCLEVVGGEDCPSDWHYAWDGEDDPWTRNGGAHLDGLCRWGTCDVRHGPFCNIETFLTPAGYTALKTAISAGDVATLERALADHPNQVVLNVARSAMQVLDCEKAVTLHAPLAREIMARLAAPDQSFLPQFEPR